MTKIFCDIADINLINTFNKKKIVKGFTTNPSLIRKAGAKNYSNYCKNILKVTKKPISFEVFADDTRNIIKQAIKIKNWSNQIT
jgi:Transaldolase